MTSQKASFVKLKGHADAKEFARLIGLDDDYKNDPQAKKDVIDLNGDAHSLKSGEGFWQVFLYGKNRFTKDTAFLAMSGIGQIMLDCINSIPDSKEEYQANKGFHKKIIAEYMQKLCLKLQEPYRLEAFLRKSIFEGSQVSYLTIKHENIFHVFWHDDVINTFLKNISIANSNGDQKVLLKLNFNCGEIEMRNGEDHHHKEMKFRLHKLKITNLLIGQSKIQTGFGGQILVYDGAIKKFIKSP